MQHPVCWTVQSVLHISSPGRPVHSNKTQIWLLWEAFSHVAITAQRVFTHIFVAYPGKHVHSWDVERTKMPKHRNSSKGDSNQAHSWARFRHSTAEPPLQSVVDSMCKMCIHTYINNVHRYEHCSLLMWVITSTLPLLIWGADPSCRMSSCRSLRQVWFQLWFCVCPPPLQWVEYNGEWMNEWIVIWQNNIRIDSGDSDKTIIST